MPSTIGSEEITQHFTHATVAGQYFTAVTIAKIQAYMIYIISPITGTNLLVMAGVGKFVKD